MGFSIPLTLIFYQIIVYIFLFNEKIDVKLAIIIGILAGLAINTRFDTQLSMLTIAIIINLKNKKISVKETLIYLGILFLFMLPWIIYSKIFFNSFYVSDNSRAVLSSSLDGLDFYSPIQVDTIFTEPIAWIKIYFTKKLPIILLVFYMNLIISTYFLIPVLFFKNNFKKNWRITYNYIITSLIFLVLFGIITISGFFWEIRYFIPIIWFTSLIIMFYFPSNKKYLEIILILIIFVFSILQFKEWLKYFKNYDIYKQHQEIYLKPERFKNIINNIKDVKDPTVMFLYTNVKNFRFFSALTEIKSFTLSGNIYENKNLFKYFINDYNFNYIYIDTNNFKKFDFENDIYDYNYEMCEIAKQGNKLPNMQNYECLTSVNINNGSFEIVKINEELFKEIKKYFNIIPTKNKSLFRVIRK